MESRTKIIHNLAIGVAVAVLALLVPHDAAAQVDCLEDDPTTLGSFYSSERMKKTVVWGNIAYVAGD